MVMWVTLALCAPQLIHGVMTALTDMTKIRGGGGVNSEAITNLTKICIHAKISEIWQLMPGWYHWT